MNETNEPKESGRRMKVNVARAQFAEKEKLQAEQRLKMIRYAVAIGCIACREKWNFGKQRLDRLVRGAYEEIFGYYEHYGGDPQTGMVPENVPTLYYGIRNQVKCLDIPLEEIEVQYALKPEFKVWRNETDRMKRQVRYEEELSMQMVTRAYWYGMVMFLWHAYGYGETVLTEFYRRVQEQWKNVMDYYLQCTPGSDVTVKKTIESGIRRIEDLGVRF